MSHLTYIMEDQVKGLLSWPEVYEAVEMALRSVCQNESGPVSSQPARTATRGINKSDLLFSMSGFIGNYKLTSIDPDQIHNTMACKLVTYFAGNPSRDPPLPTILASIMLMSTETGQLEAIVEGTEITKWRTAAASLVATQTLYFNRPSVVAAPQVGRILSIVGCGIQGEIHAIGMACIFGQIKEIRLYNRTIAKRDLLHGKLNSLRNSFKSRNLILTKADSVSSCVQNADIIVVATSSSTPLILKQDLKENVHINAVGAGVNHYSEIDPIIYNQCQLYPDNWESSRTELAGIYDKITGIIGEVILDMKPQPFAGITIFQSMGMAVEDATVAQLMLEKFKKRSA